MTNKPEVRWGEVRCAHLPPSLNLLECWTLGSKRYWDYPETSPLGISVLTVFCLFSNWIIIYLKANSSWGINLIRLIILLCISFSTKIFGVFKLHAQQNNVFAAICAGYLLYVSMIGPVFWWNWNWLPTINMSLPTVSGLLETISWQSGNSAYL